MIINPLLLWFLPLAAVPLLLHLLTRLRVRTVELPTFRFLMDGYVQQRRRMKLVEWLLLILRTLFILLLVAALARPVADRWAGLFGAEGRDVVLVVDAGASTELRTASTSALQRARLASQAVVSRLGPDDHLTIIRAGRTPEVLLSGFGADPQRISTLLESIKPDPTRPDLRAALQLAEGLDRHGPRITYVVTDLTRAGWAALIREGDQATATNNNDEHVILNIGTAASSANIGVVGSAPSAEQAVASLPMRLTAIVEAGPLQQPAHTSVSLVVGERQVDSQNVILESGERRAVTFVYTPDNPGVHEARFELPPDDFESDNAFRFALNVRGRINVAAVVGDSRRNRDNPDGRMYLEAAINAPLLAAGREQRGSPLAEQRDIAQSLNVVYLTEDQLREENLRGIDVLIVGNIRMNGRRPQTIRRFVANGGGALVFAGPETRNEEANRNLFEYLALDFELGQPIGDTDDESTATTIANADTRHPVMEAFDQDDARFFTTSQLFRRFPIEFNNETTAPGSGTQTLLQSADGNAVAVAAHPGSGRLIVFGFPLTPDWTNIPLKPEFVPLLLRSIAHAAGSQLIDVVGDVKPFEPAPISLSGDWVGSPEPVLTALLPDDSRETLQPYPELSSLRSALLDTGQVGYYRFRVTAEREGQTRTAERGFAVNLNITPNELAPVDATQAAAMLGPNTIVMTPSADDPTLTGELTDRREVWRILIWITMAVIAVEFVLSTLGGGKRSLSALSSGPIAPSSATTPGRSAA